MTSGIVPGPLDDVQLLQDIYERYKQLPEEEKNSSILKTMSDILTGPIPTALKLMSSNKFHEDIREVTETIQNCADVLHKTETADKPGVLRCMIEKIPMDSLKKKVKEFCKPYLTQCESTMDEAGTKKLIDQMWKMRNEMAENYLKNSASTSSILMLVQFIKLIFVWRDISKANNLLKESKESLPEIAKNIATLQAGIVELIQLREQYEKEEEKSDSQMKIARKINLKIMTINSLYVETRDLIGDVKLTISNNVERLDVRCNEQLIDSLANSVHGVGNALNYLRFGDMVGKGLKITYGIVTAMSFVMAAANLSTYVICSNTLKQHRDTMREIRAMDNELKRIRQNILETENWLTLNEVV